MADKYPRFHRTLQLKGWLWNEYLQKWTHEKTGEENVTRTRF
jgi:hypothetical protein